MSLVEEISALKYKLGEMQVEKELFKDTIEHLQLKNTGLEEALTAKEEEFKVIKEALTAKEEDLKVFTEENRKLRKLVTEKATLVLQHEKYLNGRFIEFQEIVQNGKNRLEVLFEKARIRVGQIEERMMIEGEMMKALKLLKALVGQVPNLSEENNSVIPEQLLDYIGLVKEEVTSCDEMDKPDIIVRKMKDVVGDAEVGGEDKEEGSERMKVDLSLVKDEIESDTEKENEPWMMEEDMDSNRLHPNLIDIKDEVVYSNQVEQEESEWLIPEENQKLPEVEETSQDNVNQTGQEGNVIVQLEESRGKQANVLNENSEDDSIDGLVPVQLRRRDRSFDSECTTEVSDDSSDSID